MKNVLLIEDDPQITEVVTYYLTESGAYSVQAAACAADALAAVQAKKPDVILMDIMLPDTDGVTLCRQIRQQCFVPILFISCIDNDDTIVQALNMGGDDYIVKPFSGPVLLARIESVLRRIGSAMPEKPLLLQSRTLQLNTRDHTVYKNGEPLRLAPTEFALLTYFLQHQNEVLEFERLYQSIWQQESNGDVRTLFVHVRTLRKKIEEDTSTPRIIKTIFKSGYVFCDE